jgi:hypothetical protein
MPKLDPRFRKPYKYEITSFTKTNGEENSYLVFGDFAAFFGGDFRGAVFFLRVAGLVEELRISTGSLVFNLVPN